MKLKLEQGEGRAEDRQKVKRKGKREKRLDFISSLAEGKVRRISPSWDISRPLRPDDTHYFQGLTALQSVNAWHPGWALDGPMM